MAPNPLTSRRLAAPAVGSAHASPTGFVRDKAATADFNLWVDMAVSCLELSIHLVRAPPQIVQGMEYVTRTNRWPTPRSGSRVLERRLRTCQFRDNVP